MFNEQHLRMFICESNLIEGIEREPTEAEITIARGFLSLAQVSVQSLQTVVDVFEPGAKLRDKVGMGVRIRKHIASPGGPEITKRLGGLIAEAVTRSQYCTPYSIHCQYQTLHPFTDGNGRSGRLLWLWMMVKQHVEIPPLGFLRTFYYQALAASDNQHARHSDAGVK